MTPPRETSRPQPSKSKAKENTGNGSNTDTDTLPEKHELTPALRKLKSQIAELYVSVGLMVMPVERLGGALLAKQSEDLADDWARLAESDPEVKRILTKVVSAGGWGSVVMGHAMIGMAVLVNRGVGPDQIAAGIAFTVVTKHPDLREFFDHERFTGSTTPPAGGNGSGDPRT